MGSLISVLCVSLYSMSRCNSARSVMDRTSSRSFSLIIILIPSLFLAKLLGWENWVYHHISELWNLSRRDTNKLPFALMQLCRSEMNKLSCYFPFTKSYMSQLLSHAMLKTQHSSNILSNMTETFNHTSTSCTCKGLINMIQLKGKCFH